VQEKTDKRTDRQNRATVEPTESKGDISAELMKSIFIGQLAASEIKRQKKTLGTNRPSCTMGTVLHHMRQSFFLQQNCHGD